MKNIAGVRLIVKLKWLYSSCTEYKANEIYRLLMLDFNKYIIKEIDVFSELSYKFISYMYDKNNDNVVPHSIGVILNADVDWQIDPCSEGIAYSRVDSIKVYLLECLKNEVNNEDVEIEIDINEFIDESEFW